MRGCTRVDRTTQKAKGNDSGGGGDQPASCDTPSSYCGVNIEGAKSSAIVEKIRVHPVHTAKSDKQDDVPVTLRKTKNCGKFYGDGRDDLN